MEPANRRHNRRANHNSGSDYHSRANYNSSTNYNRGTDNRGYRNYNSCAYNHIRYHKDYLLYRRAELGRNNQRPLLGRKLSRNNMAG